MAPDIFQTIMAPEPISTKRFFSVFAEQALRRDGHGRTPLHLAAASGRADFVRLALKAGADPNARDENGRTALHALCSETQPGQIGFAIARDLIAAGADITAEDESGRVPSDLAREGHSALKAAGFRASRSKRPAKDRPAIPIETYGRHISAIRESDADGRADLCARLNAALADIWRERAVYVRWPGGAAPKPAPVIACDESGPFPRFHSAVFSDRHPHHPFLISSLSDGRFSRRLFRSAPSRPLSRFEMKVFDEAIPALVAVVDEWMTKE